MKYLGIISAISFIIISGAHYAELIQPTNYNEVEYNQKLIINDTLAVLQAGMLAFHAPSPVLKGSCAGCHIVEKAGFSNERFPSGNRGLFDELLTRFRDGVIIDKPDIRTPPIINSYTVHNSLTGGELGSGGFNQDVPFDKMAAFKNQNALGFDGIYTQCMVGIDAHFMDPLVESCKSDTVFQKLLNKGFKNGEVSKLTLSVAIGMYEKSITASESNFQRYLRNETNLKYADGWKIFQDKCISCHSGPAFGNENLAQKIGDSDFIGRFRMTGDSSDIGVVKVPQLYNLADAPGMFHNAEDISIYKAIKKHDIEMSYKDRRAVSKFVEKDLYDPNLKRYLNY